MSVHAALKARQPVVAMSEAQLSECVRQLCASLGLLAYHTHDSRFSAKGFPDWVIVIPPHQRHDGKLGQWRWPPGGVLFRELKSATGKLTQAQEEWSTALKEAGADVKVWQPEHWLSGAIKRELRSLAAA